MPSHGRRAKEFREAPLHEIPPLDVVKTKISVLLLSLSVIIYLGYSWYRYSKFKVYTQNPSVALEVNRWNLRNEKGSEDFDVGYARFSAPIGTLAGPIKEENYSILIFNPSEKNRQLVLMEPFFLELQKELDEYNAYFLPKLDSIWELTELSMNEEGFTFPEMLTMGIRERQKRFLMSMVKYMLIGDCNKVSRFENESISVYILEYEEVVNLQVRAKANGWSQGILVGTNIGNQRHLIDSILQTYSFDDSILTIEDLNTKFAEQNFPKNINHNKASEENAEHAPRAQHPSS